MNAFQNAKIKGVRVSYDDYSAESAARGSMNYVVGSHTIAEVLRNPQRWILGYESPPSKAKEYGDLLDCLALNPMSWPKRFCCTPVNYTAKDGTSKPWRNDMRIAEVAAWHESHEGLTIVKSELNAQVHAALKRLNEDDRASDLLTCGDTQVWVAADYVDTATKISIPVRALIDIVPRVDHPIFGKCLADLKTTRNASPRMFAREVFAYNYHLQAAFYLDIFVAATGLDKTDFIHLVQENYPPNEFRMPLLAGTFIDAGRRLYQKGLSIYARCLKEGFWPGYDGKEEWPITEPEPWMISMDQVYEDIEEDEDEQPKEEGEVVP